MLIPAGNGSVDREFRNVLFGSLRRRHFGHLFQPSPTRFQRGVGIFCKRIGTAGCLLPVSGKERTKSKEFIDSTAWHSLPKALSTISRSGDGKLALL